MIYSRVLSPCVLCVAAAFLFLCTSEAKADILSDNLSKKTEGTGWVAASFTTGGAMNYSLSSAILLLGNPLPGTAELDLYSDTGQPGSPVGTLTPPKGSVANASRASGTVKR